MTKRPNSGMVFWAEYQECCKFQFDAVPRVVQCLYSRWPLMDMLFSVDMVQNPLAAKGQ